MGYSSPAMAADGTIYVGSGDNNLHAFNPRWLPEMELRHRRLCAVVAGH